MFKKLKETWTKYQAKLFVISKWLRIPFFAVIIGFLGSYAGSHGTSLLWRRCGIPVISMVYAYITIAPTVGYIKALWLITIMSVWGGMSLGYGIPDNGYPENPQADTGSTLGRFWWSTFKKNHVLADYFTRATVGFLKWVGLLSVPLLKGNWITYGFGGLGLILSDSLLGWRDFGSFEIEFLGKKVQFCWSDVINYTVQGIIISSIITFLI